MVGVEPAGVRQHPQLRALDRFRLLAERRLRPIERDAIRPDADDRHSVRAVASHLALEGATAGADLIKIFASKSIREGGTKTMTDDQLRAACGEATAAGLRTLVHAHAADAIIAPNTRRVSVTSFCDASARATFRMMASP